MKTFSQWLWGGVKEKAGIISPSKYYYGENMGDKSSNSKFKRITFKVLAVLILVAYWAIAVVWIMNLAQGG